MSFKKGDYLADSNSPLFSMTSSSKIYYKYYYSNGDMYGTPKVLKTNVTVKKYEMNRLPTSLISNGVRFINNKKEEICIFPLKSNGHKIIDWDKDITSTLAGSYVLKYEMGAYILRAANNNVELYRPDEGRTARKSSQIKGIVESMIDAEFDKAGNMTSDGNYFSEAPVATSDCIHSVAYIASEDALYFNGTLYYRQK